MDTLLPKAYLFGLTGLLLIVAFLVGRQVLKVRRDEVSLVKLEKGGANASKDSAALYELASVQLRKRLYPQAATTLRKALKRLDNEPGEAKALIENALGFSLAAQEDFSSAISHYKAAIKAKSDYPVAINNLAFAKQRLNQEDEAKELYKEVLNIDPRNKTATRQIKQLEKKNGQKSTGGGNGLGF